MIIFISIFAVVIIGLIIIAFVGNKRDTNEKKEVLKNLKIVEEEAKINHLMIYSLLKELLDFVDTKKREFEQNPHMVSLGDVTEKSSTVLKLILESTELKNLYKSEDRKAEFKPVMDEFKSVKPVNWRKNASFAVSLIEAKSKYSKPSESLEKVKIYLWN